MVSSLLRTVISHIETVLFWVVEMFGAVMLPYDPALVSLLPPLGP